MTFGTLIHANMTMPFQIHDEAKAKQVWVIIFKFLLMNATKLQSHFQKLYNEVCALRNAPTKFRHQRLLQGLIEKTFLLPWD